MQASDMSLSLSLHLPFMLKLLQVPDSDFTLILASALGLIIRKFMRGIVLSLSEMILIKRL
jgi:hypothetical protein